MVNSGRHDLIIFYSILFHRVVFLETLLIYKFLMGETNLTFLDEATIFVILSLTLN